MSMTTKNEPAEVIEMRRPETSPRPKLVEPLAYNASGAEEQPILPLRSIRAQVEISAIKSALNRTGWNRKQAARLLKISYRGLLYKIHRHQIVPTTEHS